MFHQQTTFLKFLLTCLNHIFKGNFDRIGKVFYGREIAEAVAEQINLNFYFWIGRPKSLFLLCHRAIIMLRENFDRLSIDTKFHLFNKFGLDSFCVSIFYLEITNWFFTRLRYVFILSVANDAI